VTSPDELRQLLADATPGPWEQAPWFTNTILPKRWIDGDQLGVDPNDRGPFSTVHAHSAADAALIVAAVNALPSLLDELDRIAGELAGANDYSEELEAERHDLRVALADAIDGFEECTGEYPKDLYADDLERWRALIPETSEETTTDD
jgi:hypothetical protein